MDLAGFRANFPEFADTTKYPDTLLTFWSAFGEMRCTAAVWGDMRDNAVQLYTAHAVTIAKQQQSGLPGSQAMPISSKAVDKLSVSYDTALAKIEGAGNYNLTTYGRDFYQLVRLAGMGGVQLGAGPDLGEFSWAFGVVGL